MFDMPEVGDWQLDSMLTNVGLLQRYWQIQAIQGGSILYKRVIILNGYEYSSHNQLVMAIPDWYALRAEAWAWPPALPDSPN